MTWPLKQYLAADHLTVVTLANVQSIPDKQLAASDGRHAWLRGAVKFAVNAI